MEAIDQGTYLSDKILSEETFFLSYAKRYSSREIFERGFLYDTINLVSAKVIIGILEGKKDKVLFDLFNILSSEHFLFFFLDVFFEILVMSLDIEDEDKKLELNSIFVNGKTFTQKSPFDIFITFKEKDPYKALFLSCLVFKKAL